jgi:hypothetical protein
MEHSTDNKYDGRYSDEHTLSMIVKVMTVKLTEREKQSLLMMKTCQK